MDRQRIDKWLWHARVVRTRSAASSLVVAGLVRVNGERIAAPSRPVRPGDVLSVYSVAILPDGAAETQIYVRTLTPEGNLK